MLRIKNWGSYQSYKDRNPPWIRLSKSLLDNYEFQLMSANARALLPMLWLLASEDENPVSGLIRFGYEKIAFRLRLDLKSVKSAIDEIIRAGFIVEENQDVMNPSRECNQSVTPETETETETENRKRFSIPDFIDVKDWKDFEQMRRVIKKPMTDRARKTIFNKLEKLKDEGHDIKQILENSITNNWQDVYPPKTKPTNGKSLDELLEKF
jgi:hypothetical protein